MLEAKGRDETEGKDKGIAAKDEIVEVRGGDETEDKGEERVRG